jgi:zinc protease
MHLRRCLERFGFLLAVTACGSTPPPAAAPATPQPTATASAPQASVDEYATLPPEQREAPPPAAAAPSWSFPKLEEKAIANGLSVQVVERHTLPLVDIKLIVRSGQATDGERGGLATLSGEMLKVGGSGQYASRQLLNRVESLGSNLQVITSRDATSINLAVTSDRFAEAMELLGLVVRKPQFNAQEFTKLRRRELDRVQSSAKSDAGWAASMVMYRELYQGVDGPHPYANYDASPKDLEKRELWEVKQWYQTHFTPSNAFLLVVGDVTPALAQEVAEKTLGSWRGKARPAQTIAAPKALSGLNIVLVDRPKSSQAEVRLAVLGPERKSEDWVGLRVANQVLGGGAAGRLFQDVREKQSLAYAAYSTLDEVAQGPCPIVLRAGTQTAKAGLTLKALLDHGAAMANQPAEQHEVSIATQYLADVFLVNVESVSDVSALSARLSIFGLGADYYDRYRTAVRSVQAPSAQAAFAKYVKPGSGLVVVAGDAERLAVPLSHFGAVRIVNPDDGFKDVRTVPHNPAAPIELPRIDGT